MNPVATQSEPPSDTSGFTEMFSSHGHRTYFSARGKNATIHLWATLPGQSLYRARIYYLPLSQRALDGTAKPPEVAGRVPRFGCCFDAFGTEERTKEDDRKEGGARRGRAQGARARPGALLGVRVFPACPPGGRKGSPATPGHSRSPIGSPSHCHVPAFPSIRPEGTVQSQLHFHYHSCSRPALLYPVDEQSPEVMKR